MIIIIITIYLKCRNMVNMAQRSSKAREHVLPTMAISNRGYHGYWLLWLWFIMVIGYHSYQAMVTMVNVVTIVTMVTIFTWVSFMTCSTLLNLSKGLKPDFGGGLPGRWGFLSEIRWWTNHSGVLILWWRQGRAGIVKINLYQYYSIRVGHRQLCMIRHPFPIGTR